MNFFGDKPEPNQEAVNVLEYSPCFPRLLTSCCFKTLRMASSNLCSATEDSKDLAVFLMQQASVSNCFTGFNLLTAIWEEALGRPLPRTSVLPLKSKGHRGMGQVLVMPLARPQAGAVACSGSFRSVSTETSLALSELPSRWWCL